MIDRDQLDLIDGCTVHDSEGNKIGKAGQVYLDDQTGQPAWVTVNTGLFGTNESFVPLTDATLSGDVLSVPYDKDTVKNAPNVAPDGHLTPEEEQDLYEHYGLSFASADVPASSEHAESGGPGADTDAHRGRNGDDAMTRSEERVEIGTRSEESGRAKLRKYVVTENVTQTVPVRREKAVLEHEPITDENVDEATSGEDISDAEHEVVLHEERPVVDKAIEPVERVRLGTEEVRDEETVQEEVRKEQIQVEGDVEVDTDRNA